tara:strand:- start:987 stop:1262 length:276 start_codon:yes stop_codon:yes gene_type:complete
MTLTAEITIYVIAIIIVTGMAFITHAVIDMNKKLNNRINTVKNQLMSLILTGPRSEKQKTKIDQHLEGDVELTHPTTGDKIKARAKFRIKK